MGKSIWQILVVFFAITLSGITAAREITREDALKLPDECQLQREQNIAPMRAQAIEDCVTNKRGDREYCERYNRTYGNGRPRAGGGMTRGMFWELPVCQDSHAASQFFRMNPGKEVYTLPQNR